MPFDQELLRRLRAVLPDREEVVEKKMFGSVAVMVRGNMACGLYNNQLIVRIGSEAVSLALQEPDVKPMDFTGKVMRSYASIEPAGLKTDAQLRRWVEMSIAFADSLTPKELKPRDKPKKSKRKI